MSNQYKSYTRLGMLSAIAQFPNKAQRSLCSVEKQYELKYKIGQGKHYKKHLSALNRSTLRSITSYVRAQLDKCLLLISRCLQFLSRELQTVFLFIIFGAKSIFRQLVYNICTCISTIRLFLRNFMLKETIIIYIYSWQFPAVGR